MGIGTLCSLLLLIPKFAMILLHNNLLYYHNHLDIRAATRQCRLKRNLTSSLSLKLTWYIYIKKHNFYSSRHSESWPSAEVIKHHQNKCPKCCLEGLCSFRPKLEIFGSELSRETKRSFFFFTLLSFGNIRRR